jgi:hypothetical protein
MELILYNCQNNDINAESTHVDIPQGIGPQSREHAMPGVTIHLPRGTLRNALVKRAFIEDIKRIVSYHLNGLDYESCHMGLTPEEVTVILIPYELDDVSLDTPFVVKIDGLDFPDRMVSLSSRLTAIGADIKQIVVDFVDPNLVDYETEPAKMPDKLVSVSFNSQTPHSWVSV